MRVELPLQLKAYAARVDQRLEQILRGLPATAPLLTEAMQYSGLAPGKRLRPALVLAAAEATGGNLEDALDAACAVEMVHAFSLIHDDLPAIDNDDLRRGRPTCHIKFGEAIAILAGDGLFSLAFTTLVRMEASPCRVVEAVRVLSDAANRLVAGEALDILSEGKPVVTETLVKIHAEKTAALIAASCELGAIFGGGNPEQILALRHYGEDVGLAFQIADDILNETSTPEQLGKAAGSDREREKATYPALFGLEASRKAALDAVEAGIAELRVLPNREVLTQLANYSVARLY